MQNHGEYCLVCMGIKTFDPIYLQIRDGVQLAVEAHKNLYQRNMLAEFIENDLGKEGVLLNLASNEYAKVLRKQI